MKLEKVVPFGRSLDEYRLMFKFTEDDLDKNIIDIGAGPASFNAEMFSHGKSIISVDPLYNFQAEDIKKQFYSVVDSIIDQVRATEEDWVWSYHTSPENLKVNREHVLHRFLDDYEKGKADGRYITGELPKLDFYDGQFEIAVCSHFLFLYSDHFTYEFHLQSVLEILRVAKEVRIFPLLTLILEKSPYLDSLIQQLESLGFEVSIEKVKYELQKGGNEMLRIRKTFQ